MKILIVEDDIHAALRLKTILKSIDPQIVVIDTCKSVKNTILWFENNEHPDLLFLDIQLSDGISFEIFDDLTINCPTIFVTAFNDYAVEAFKINSIDYILKPYSPTDIKKAIEKYNKIHTQQITPINKTLISELKNMLASKYKSRFFAKINRTVYSIAVDEILFFNFEDNATILVRDDHRSFVINYSLDALEDYLDPKHFFRINRKYIIHINSIKKMNVLSKSRIDVILHDNTKEMVSRSKSKIFRQWLDL